MQTSLFALAVADNEPKTPVNQGVDTPLDDVVFTVIDIETTGLSPKKNAITEITAIQYKNGQELGQFSTLVKPTEAISDIARNITGISEDMVQMAPPLVSVLPDLAAFVGPNPVIVGHNVSFDIGFIREKFEQNGMVNLMDRFELTRAACTKTLAVKLLPGLPSYEGVVVATQCNVVNDNPHRAEADVRMAAGILFSLIGKLKQDNPDIKTLGDLLTLQGELR